MSQEWIKDPDSVLDYVFDWSDWMIDGDTIISSSISITPSNHNSQLILEQESTLSDRVVIWLSQGRKNTRYSVTCSITTDDGRQEDSTRCIRVLNK